MSNDDLTDFLDMDEVEQEFHKRASKNFEQEQDLTVFIKKM